MAFPQDFFHIFFYKMSPIANINDTLTLCLLTYLSSADFFQNQLFLKNTFGNTIRVSYSLDPDQARHSVGPDLGSNC